MSTRLTWSGHRAPLGWLLLPFMLGLVAGKLAPGPVPALPLTLAGVAFLLMASFGTDNRPGRWAGLLATGMICLGGAYYEHRRDREVEWDDWPPREARLTVQIDRIFAGATAADRMAGIGRIKTAPRHLVGLVGQRVAFSLQLDPAEPSPFRGVQVAMVGVLEPLPRRPPVDDEFVAYLVDAGLNFRLGRGRLAAIVSPGNAYARARESARRQCAAWLGRGLERHPELAGALRGMLLGERAGLSAEQEDLFLRSGTMHLFAISGLHISVIAGGILGVLRALRLGPLGRFLGGAALLWLYVDLTGAVPSAVRAWLMVVCLHGALVVRAPGNLPSALSGSALLVLLLDPMQLFGAGFQMSYGIVAALLLYGVPLADRWIGSTSWWSLVPLASLAWWQRTAILGGKRLQTALAVGLAASLIGTISGVAFFGIFTPVAIIANLPLIPLAGISILAGFASLLSGVLFAGPLVILFNHAGAVVLWFMQAILVALIGLPGATAPAAFRAPWLGETALMLVLGTMLWGYATRWSVRGAWWVPVVTTLVVLAAGMKLVA